MNINPLKRVFVGLELENQILELDLSKFKKNSINSIDTVG
jgi:hypothetical protein